MVTMIGDNPKDVTRYGVYGEFFDLGGITRRIRDTWPNKPATWETAASIIITELAWANGLSMQDASEEQVLRMFHHGKIVDLARGALRDLVPKTEYERLQPSKDYPYVKSTYRDIVDLLASKQHDYGPDNILRSPRGPEVGLEIRLWDKVARFLNLRSKGVPAHNESLVDTLMDIVGYTVILVMVRLGWFTLPLQADMIENSDRKANV